MTHRQVSERGSWASWGTRGARGGRAVVPWSDGCAAPAAPGPATRRLQLDLGLFRAAILAAVLGLASAWPHPARAADTPPPPAADYARLPAIGQVALSPNGRRLAMVTPGREGRMQAAVLDLAPLGAPRVVAAFADVDVHRVRWVNDDRLVAEVFESRAEVRSSGAGVVAVNHDGSDARNLIVWRLESEGTSRFEARVLPYGWFIHSTLDDGSADILVVRHEVDGSDEHVATRLGRLNTTTGVLRNLSEDAPPFASHWMVDGKGTPRIAASTRNGVLKLFARDAAGSAWKPLEEFKAFVDVGFEPLHVDADGTLFVLHRGERDTSALHAYDPAKRQLDKEPLVAVNGFDLDPHLQLDTRTRRVMGLHFRAARPMSYWFDEELAALQRGIDQALPGRFNRLHCGRCETTPFIVVQSESDRDPGRYFLFDRQKKSLQPIGAVQPWVEEARQGRRTFHRITSRDGLSLPVYVTHPPGSAPTDPLPAVVLVHGGPWVRGSDLRWDAEAQFLASRGYRVIEPEFRGSTGYGFKLFKGGWKQWGLAMQDDLEDAVQWAAREKLVDARRVCVMGGSYGGYAALMGPIRHPGAWRCAVSFAGVTDIELMFSIYWSDVDEQAKQVGLPVLVERLLEQGAEDRRVDALPVERTQLGHERERVGGQREHRSALAHERGTEALDPTTAHDPAAAHGIEECA